MFFLRRSICSLFFLFKLFVIFLWRQFTNMMNPRVYLYRWPPHSGELNELLKIEQMKDSQGSILVQKTSPGLSAYAVSKSL